MPVPSKKTICVLGPLFLQNQLLCRLLEERLSVKSIAALTFEGARSLLGQKYNRVTLFLWDCGGQDLAAFSKGLGKFRKEIPVKSLLGLFNVGKVRLKDPKVLLKGINGVFLERVSIEEIVSGVSRILQGELCLPTEESSDDPGTRESLESGSNVPITMLTPCEKRILGLIQEGKSNQQIAGVLSVKPVSVKQYIYKLFKKIKVSNRTQTVLWAYEKLQQ